MANGEGYDMPLAVAREIVAPSPLAACCQRVGWHQENRLLVDNVFCIYTTRSGFELTPIKSNSLSTGQPTYKAAI